MTARGLSAWTRQCGNDGGQPQCTGVGLRPGISHNRAGHCLPGRRGPTRHHSEGCNLKYAVAKVVRHARRPSSGPTTDCEQQPPGLWAANQKHPQPCRGQWASGPGPARARTRGSTSVADSDPPVEQTALIYSISCGSIHRGAAAGLGATAAELPGAATRRAQSLPSGPRLTIGLGKHRKDIAGLAH